MIWLLLRPKLLIGLLVLAAAGATALGVPVYATAADLLPGFGIDWLPL